MAKLPGPWKYRSKSIVASDGTPVLWINSEGCSDSLGLLSVNPKVARMLSSVPRMHDLLGRLDGLSETKAAQLYMSSDHLRVLGEISDLLKEIEASPSTMPGSVQFPLVEGSRFRFRTMNFPQMLLYGTLSQGTGLPLLINTARVEWHERTEDFQAITSWTETMDGGAEGKWSRPRETILDLRVAEGLDSPDRQWTVVCVDRRRGRLDTSLSHPTVGEDEIYIEAESAPVRCRFFLGEGRMGGRPLYSLVLE